MAGSFTSCYFWSYPLRLAHHRIAPALAYA
jgi:hypothetical protein